MAEVAVTSEPSLLSSSSVSEAKTKSMRRCLNHLSYNGARRGWVRYIHYILIFWIFPDFFFLFFFSWSKLVALVELNCGFLPQQKSTFTPKRHSETNTQEGKTRIWQERSGRASKSSTMSSSSSEPAPTVRVMRLYKPGMLYILSQLTLYPPTISRPSRSCF